MNRAGIDDMIMLTKVNESGINDNLQKRFKSDIIYTYIGNVLISVNPFKNIKDLYSERLLKDYRGKYPYELPPHVYSLADGVYRQLLQEGKNQCVIISGESGAGKTEASKKILQFIAAASSNSEDVKRVNDVILGSNPLLEAFGNAKTLRNNNSSRFGKYMEIQFNLRGDPEGGKITNYLLEKSRVVGQVKGERNFHIFYQLLKGADQNLRQKLYLKSPKDYEIISKCLDVDTIDDVAEFKDTHEAMKTMNMSNTEIEDIFKIISAILYLGNLQFTEDDKEQSHVSNKQDLDIIAKLLGSNPKDVENSICYRTISSGSARSSVYKCSNNKEQAVYTRDALSKTLYSRLFDWIVQKVNQAMYLPENSTTITIGILDIYGFEIFDENGFEQLCINFVNEKLQQIFIELTLKREQEEYESEGIKWEPIPYFNNKICCDLIESKKPIGILTLLDDVSNFPKGTDEVFYEKMGTQFGDHKHFAYSNKQKRSFLIKHYAGDVEYSVNNFLDKNKDLLSVDLIELGGCSSSELIASLYPEVGQKEKKRPTTAGFKIKTSINELVDALGKCSAHYIRCIKPNDTKRAGDYDDKRCEHQIKYLGLLENVRVRRAGFAYRQEYKVFFYRYRVVCPKTFPKWSGDAVSGCIEILNSCQLTEGNDFQKGKTMLFVRKPETIFQFEELRDRTVSSFANKIQRFFQKFALQQKNYELLVKSNKVVLGKKERRRLSVSRKFLSDYICYRENFELKGIVKSLAGNDEKIYFADNVTEYVKGKGTRKVLLISKSSLYIIGIVKNKSKDKDAVKKRPFVYECSRQFGIQGSNDKLNTIMMSTLQDGFLLLRPSPGGVDTLVDCRRKTELVGTVLELNSQVSVSFSDIFNVTLKGNKSKEVKFNKDPQNGTATGSLKSGLLGFGGITVNVTQGDDKNTDPKLEPPKQIERVNVNRNQRVQQPKETKPTPQPKVSPQPKFNQPTPQKNNPVSPQPKMKNNPPPKNKMPPQNNLPPKKEPQPKKVPPKKVPPKKVGGNQPKCKVLYDFSPENHDELELRAGDLIVILDDSDVDWWKGTVNGNTGLFPSSYVQRI
eukprot:TRINITY_DN5339_c0_g1_i2.p1 TRINITY_DN5339_c0_g1~~TRINITY_DN5339_c0_g1_i2.p1  ORF type:complete len:1073 (-),score=394.85 TRINITY_DN5339_c0_g1_i2:98-3316(-)